MEEQQARYAEERQVSRRSRRLVLDSLRDHGPLSQADLAKRTGLARTTIIPVLSELIRRGMVQRDSAKAARRGRPHEMFRLIGDRAHVIGIVFGKHNLRLGIGTLDYRPVSPQEEPVFVPIDPKNNAATSISEAVSGVQRLLKGLDDRRPIIGIGLGLPAPLHRSGELDTTMASPDILPGWKLEEVVAELHEKFGAPVIVENDANLGALGETLKGAGRGYRMVLYIKAGTGIGGGLVWNGEMLLGSTGSAGEIGHIIVGGEDTPVDECGHRGCLQAVAGGDAIVEFVRARVNRYLTLGHVIRHATAPPDPGTDDGLDAREAYRALRQACQRSLEEASTKIGLVAGDLCNVLNPDCVILGGSLSRPGQLTLMPLRRSIVSRVVDPTSSMQIVSGQLGRWAEVYGAWAVASRSEAAFDCLERLLAD
jgi:predicted NBD/HSP70 family sugar kinase